MSHEGLYSDRFERTRRLSDWIRKNLDRRYLGVTDLDGMMIEIRTTHNYRKGVLKFAFYEYKSRSPIMGVTQFLAFDALDQLFRHVAMAKHYAGFFLIVYHADYIDLADPRGGFDVHKAPFERVEETHQGNTVIQSVNPRCRLLGASLREVVAICSLRADVPRLDGKPLGRGLCGPRPRDHPDR